MTRRLAVVMAVALAANAQEFRLAVLGCPMAHCDPSMSDRVLTRVPWSVTAAWLDASVASDDTGLGCSATATLAVCTFGADPKGAARAALKAYDASGNTLWDSGTALNSTAWTSVPLIARSGDVIAADDASLVRFAANGAVLWKTATAGGRPISPTLLDNGVVVLATSGGPVSSYDSRGGQRLATLDLTDTLDGRRGRFETTNTPGARGNRIYISTEFKPDDGGADPRQHARLYAVDAGVGLTVAWYFEFGARSGASPLVVGDVVFFDGDRSAPGTAFAPRFFAVRDEGTAPRLLWQYELGGPAAASAARDPRGGLWVFALGATQLVRLSERDGAVLDTLDLAAVSGVAGARPWSAMSIALGRRGEPVMMVSAKTQTSPWVMAVGLDSRSLVWKQAAGEDGYRDLPRGQWPVLATRDGRRVVVFTTRNGVQALAGEP